MTTSISSFKRTSFSLSPDSKRQKTAISRTDQRIEEILKNPKLIKNNHNLLIQWHKMAKKDIPEKLKGSYQSANKAVAIDLNDTFLSLAIKMKDYQLVKATLSERQEGQTNALKVAAIIHDVKIHYLFVKKALRDAKGNTMLHHLFGQKAQDGRPLPNFACFEAANPDLTLENSKGITCLELAAKHFHSKSLKRMMAYMEEKGQAIPDTQVLTEWVITYRENKKLSLSMRPVLERADFKTIGRFAKVSRHANKIARKVLEERAEVYGFNGSNQIEKIDLLRKFKRQIHQLKHYDLLPERINLDTIHTLTVNEIIFLLSREVKVFIESDENPRLLHLHMPELLELNSYWQNATGTPENQNESALALCNAAYYAEPALVEQLLKHGASLQSCKPTDPDTIWNNETPLHRAIRAHNLEAVKLMIEYKADVNAPSDNGTPLAVATDLVNPGIVRALLKAGADPNKHAKNEPSTLAIACKKKSTKALDECARLLEEYGAIA